MTHELRPRRTAQRRMCGTWFLLCFYVCSGWALRPYTTIDKVMITQETCRTNMLTIKFTIHHSPHSKVDNFLFSAYYRCKCPVPNADVQHVLMVHYWRHTKAVRATDIAVNPSPCIGPDALLPGIISRMSRPSDFCGDLLESEAPADSFQLPMSGPYS